MTRSVSMTKSQKLIGEKLGSKIEHPTSRATEFPKSIVLRNISSDENDSDLKYVDLDGNANFFIFKGLYD